MVRGITTTLKHTLGYFVTAAVTAAVQLFPLFWRAVGILELSCSLTVVISTLGGALANRRFLYLRSRYIVITLCVCVCVCVC